MYSHDANMLAPVAFIGFVLTLTVHIASFFGIDRLLGFYPWPIFIGVFAVWVPVAFAAQELSAKTNRNKKFWEIVFEHLPQRTRIVFGTVSVYGVYNLFVFIAQDDPRTVLHPVISTNAAITRELSGILLMFYFTAFVNLRAFSDLDKAHR